MNSFLFEQIENGFQLTVLLLMTVISIYKSLKTENETWSLMAMFFGAVTLGNIYWFLYMMFYRETPYYGFISDFCWVAAYLFMILMLVQIRDRSFHWNEHKALWLIPLFTFAMALFYMRWGAYLTNTVYALCMTALLGSAVVGILTSVKGSARRRLYYACLAYVLVEYSLWTVSCFNWDVAVLDPYVIIDVLLTAVYILIFVMSGKAVRDELH
jgi:hypothetical protein